MNETQYHEIADELLIAVEEAVEACNLDIDYESASGILTLTFPNQTKVIVNKQPPLKQIWLATKYNGYHFNLEGERWIDERFGGEFWQVLSEDSSKQAEQALVFTP